MLILSDEAGSALLAVRPCRLVDRLRAHLVGFRLDISLAAGCSPDSGRLLAARAQHLVSVSSRRALADDWEHALGKAAMASCGDRVAAAEQDVRELIARLRAPLPVTARGVAAARVLLTDGASPVYNRRSHTSLGDALRLATAYLDPSVPLFASP